MFNGGFGGHVAFSEEEGGGWVLGEGGQGMGGFGVEGADEGDDGVVGAGEVQGYEAVADSCGRVSLFKR